MNTLAKIKRYLGASGSSDNPIRIPHIKREALAAMFGELRLGRGVEVGVHRGYFSAVLCEMNSRLRLSSVDVWAKEEYYMEAIQRLRPYNCELIRLRSVMAATLFEDRSLDLLYIDGDHSRPAVEQDLEAWVRKVRTGGIVAGHDYKQADDTPAARRCQVLPVVNEYVAKHRIDPFFVIGEDFGSWPSWFWVKED